MKTTTLIPGTFALHNFVGVDAIDTLFNLLMDVDYDKSMRARWTASFGKSYDYSGKTYPYIPMPDYFTDIINSISDILGFTPNNCLINLYHDGDSSMGYHSDDTSILADGTGVVIISLGSIRTLRFRNIADRTNIIDYTLDNGSFFYMTDQIQNDWMHSIPKSNTTDPRISLTFRQIR